MLVFVIMFHIEIPNCFKQCQYYDRTADLFGFINLTFSVATALSSVCNLQMQLDIGKPTMYAHLANCFLLAQLIATLIHYQFTVALMG